MLETKIVTLSTSCGISATNNNVTARSMSIMVKATDSFHLVLSFFIFLNTPFSRRRDTGLNMYAITIPKSTGLIKLKNESIPLTMESRLDNSTYKTTAEHVAIVYETHFFLNHLLFNFMSFSRLKTSLYKSYYYNKSWILSRFKRHNLTEKAAIDHMTASIPNVIPKCRFLLFDS